MRAAEYVFNEAMQAYCAQAIQNMPDVELKACVKGMPEILRGLKQGNPNMGMIRQRVQAKLQLANPPAPILDLLRAATLSNPLVSVLSEQALERGLTALCDQFGREPIFVSMLLDHREPVQKLALTALENLEEGMGERVLPSSETFPELFGPLLATLRPILSSDTTPAPKKSDDPLLPSASKQPKAIQESDILESTVYRRLQKERNQLVRERDDLRARTSQLTGDLKQKRAQEVDLRSRLDVTQSQQAQLVARGVADALSRRLAPWLSSSEDLCRWRQAVAGAEASPIVRAQELLERQAQLDKRFGTRASVERDLLEAERLHNLLVAASQEAINPLPELMGQARELATFMETARSKLNQTSLLSASLELQDVDHRVARIQDLDKLREYKLELEGQMLSHAWGLQLCREAYSIVDRKAGALYGRIARDVDSDGYLFGAVSPTQAFFHCLVNAKPCRLLVDGHNVLPRLRPLIGDVYFTPGKGPNARGREFLVAKMKAMTEVHPLLQVDIWFDGPVEDRRSESDNLSVWYSGGQGSDRADNGMLEALKAEQYRGSCALRVIATEDRDLINKAKNLEAMDITPLELWALVG